MGVELAPMGADQAGEGVLVAVAGGVQQVLVVHRHALGCHSATWPPHGAEMTLRHPAGPSRGPSSTHAPSRRARSVTSSISSTSTYGSQSGRSVAHSTAPPVSSAP